MRPLSFLPPRLPPLSPPSPPLSPLAPLLPSLPSPPSLALPPVVLFLQSIQSRPIVCTMQAV
ncbi:hypothetical protein EGJ54_04770 [Pandoraea apista]|nr:hypothetical protein EGJ54_04770 [Pandoraea apista]RRX05372.1 hypothetical protein EGJ56_08185 [Pandoraea apista]